MARYLPTWATLAEAEQWLEAETGEPWPLPRLIESGLRPHAWFAPIPGLHPEVMSRIFDGRPEGYLSEFVFAGDLQRMAIDRRSIVIQMTWTAKGELMKMDPPAEVQVEDLRFNGAAIRELAKKSRAQSAVAVRKGELVRRMVANWPTIEADLSEASRNGLSAAARADGKGWLATAAEAWARQNGRWRDAGDPLATLGRQIVRRK